MKVCVIIPTLNEEENIGKLIDSIKKQSYKNTEIIVIDDGSNDNTKKICLSKRVKFLENKPGRKGPAFGWNRVARETSAEIICALGADFFLEDKHFIEKSVKAFDEKTVAVYNAFHTIQDSWIERALTSEYGISIEPRFIKRKDFLAISGFPEIGFGEDQVFVKKLENYSKQKRLHSKVVKHAFFSGHGVHSLQEMYKQAFWYGKTAIAFLTAFSKHASLFETLKTLFKTFSRPIYFVSFAFLVISTILPNLFFFTIPFLAILFSLIFTSCLDFFRQKNPFRFFRIFLFLVFGLGMLHGLIVNVFLADKKMGA